MKEYLYFINSLFNNLIEYKLDPKDCWQAPHETIALGTGDCEDIAIAKLFAISSVCPKARLAYVPGHMVVIAEGYTLDNTREDINKVLPNIVYTIDVHGTVYLGTHKIKQRIPKFDSILARIEDHARNFKT